MSYRIGLLFFFKLPPGFEKMGIIRHMEHGRVPQRPGRNFLSGRAVDEHRQPPVHRRRQRGITARPENGRSPRVRIDAREILGG
jgi:hypothetical protein